MSADPGGSRHRAAARGAASAPGLGARASRLGARTLRRATALARRLGAGAVRLPATLARRVPAGQRTRIAALLPGALRRAARASARIAPAGLGGRAGPGTDQRWASAIASPWTPLAGGGPADATATADQRATARSAQPRPRRACNICRWEGDDFVGPMHCEAARCPRCGSIGRDRFLFWALQRRVASPAEGPPSGARPRLLETSPRLGPAYRGAMGRWFDYLCSDFDERAHAGMVHLDLQAIELPSASIDVILTPHVLEHVPDTERALRELWRVLRPGGSLLLQVPLLQGRTAPPGQPEFHGDDTPVFWRFGPDLGDRLRAVGFEVELLVTAALRREVDRPDDKSANEPAERSWPRPVSPEFDAEDLLQGLLDGSGRPRAELAVVAHDAEADRYGFQPAYMYLTWSARKPAGA